MQVPAETYALTVTDDELEMILNALSYEHETHKELTAEYRAALEALFESLDHVGNPWNEESNATNDAKQG
jgi:hypothetical protein